MKDAENLKLSENENKIGNENQDKLIIEKIGEKDKENKIELKEIKIHNKELIKEVKKKKHESKVIDKIEFENPLIIKKEVKSTKEKPKSPFVLKVISFINKNNLKIIEEIEFKAREYRCIVEANSQLGSIKFFTEAKDKKIISEIDLKKLLSDSQKIPLPALVLYTGSISKKADEYIIEYSSILKSKRIE